MTKYDLHKRKCISKIVFLAMFAFASLLSFEASAGVCGVGMAGAKRVTPDCPDGTKARYDISPKCIEDANKSPSACLNTMPVTNVARIPEDVCYRNQGWSRKRSHNGVDYAAPIGAAVTAAMDGVITRFTFGTAEPARGVCQTTGGGYGNVIYIEHKGCDGKYTTRYGHLTNKMVPGLKEGVKVKKGQIIGYVGGTGGACGRPHLHFELRGPGDSLVNPLCDEVQSICNCKTPVPSSGLEKCKDATFAASSSTPITAVGSGITAVSITPANNSETPAAGTSSCAPYEEVRNSYRQWGCIFCKPFEILFNTASVMAKQSFAALAKAVIVVVVVAFAIWLAVITLRFVSTMEIREPRIFVKTLLNQAFRVLVVVILLNAGLATILSLSVDPVFSTGLKIAQLAGKMSDTCDLKSDNLSIVDSNTGGLSQSMGVGILCTIKAIQDQIGDILALGRVCLCLSVSSENRIFYVFPHLGYLLTGIMFYLGGVALLLIYPFMLVDCVLKLAIAVALLPAALGAFAFKITANYLTKIWEIFLNAIFSFIFLSLIIFLIAAIAADSLSEILTEDTGLEIKLFWWTIEVVKVVFICFLGWAVLGEMKKFADDFAGGLKFGGDGIGSTTASSAYEFGAKRPALALGKPVVKGAKKAGGAAKDALSERLHRARINGWRNFTAQATSGDPMAKQLAFGRTVGIAQNDKKEAMTDDDGNLMYDTTNFFQRLRGRKEYRSFSDDGHGNVRMNVTVVKKNGSRKETSTDAYGTITRRFDSNNQKLSEESKVNAMMMKRAMNKDGTYKPEVIEDFMQNSLLSEEDKQLMLVKTVMKERMSGEYDGAGFESAYKERHVEKTTDAEGRETIKVTQTNRNGTTSTFTVTLGDNNRVMSEFSTIDSNGKGKSYTSDGIVQRKSYISTKTNADGTKTTVVESRYAFTEHYSKIAGRPLYSNGTTADNIPADQIMFGKEDMKAFANQVAKKGNKAYSFGEFK